MTLAFNSFLKFGCKRFYLKWYSLNLPSVLIYFPRSFAIVKKVKCIKAAMFAELPPKKRVNLHRTPFAGFLKYHLDLSQPRGDWASNKIMSTVVNPNIPACKPEFINRLSTIFWTYNNNRKS